MQFLHYAYGPDAPKTIHQLITVDDKFSMANLKLVAVLLTLNLSLEGSLIIIFGWRPFLHQYGAFTNWTLVATIVFHALHLAVYSSK